MKKPNEENSIVFFVVVVTCFSLAKAHWLCSTARAGSHFCVVDSDRNSNTDILL